jgi:hypothetical protein
MYQIRYLWLIVYICFGWTVYQGNNNKFLLHKSYYDWTNYRIKDGYNHEEDSDKEGINVINILKKIFHFLSWRNMTIFIKTVLSHFINNIVVGYVHRLGLNNSRKELNNDFYLKTLFLESGLGGELFTVYDNYKNSEEFDIESSKNSHYKQNIGVFFIFNFLNKIYNPDETPNPIYNILKRFFFKLGLGINFGDFQYNINNNDRRDYLKFFPLHYLSLLVPTKLLKNNYNFKFKVFFYGSINIKVLEFKSIIIFLSNRFINDQLYLSWEFLYHKHVQKDILTYPYYQKIENIYMEKQLKEERKQLMSVGSEL